MKKLVVLAVFLTLSLFSFCQTDTLLAMLQAGSSNPQPGQLLDYEITYGYMGTLDKIKGKLYFVKDPALTLNGVTPAATAVSKDTLFWDVDLASGEGYLIDLSFKVAANIPPGNRITVKSFIQSVTPGVSLQSSDSITLTYHPPTSFEPAFNDQQGIQWVKSAGDSSITNFELPLIDSTQSGQIIVAGTGQSSTSADQGLLIQQLTKDGAVLWKKLYSDFPVSSVKSMKILHNGSILIAGDQLYNPPNTNLNRSLFYNWLQLFDPTGNRTWSKYIMIDTTAAVRQSNYLSNICEAADGAIYATGNTFYTTETDTDSTTAWITKLDASGNVSWSKRYAHSNGTIMFNDITLSNDNQLMLAGSSNEYSTGMPAGVLYKIDAGSGNIIWRNDTLGIGQVRDVFIPF